MTTRARTASIIAAGALFLVVPACGSSGDGGSAATTTAKPKASGDSTSASSSGTKIVIKDFDFAPKTLEAKAGAVAVENEDGTNHSVTADDGAFDTGKFASGTKQIDVTKPGTYTYHCAVHPFMTGTIVVK
jgi:plastocyanin